MLGDLDAAPLRAAGWQVAGRLAVDPFAGGRFQDARGYLDAVELIEDADLDAVAVDGAVPELAAMLPRLRRAGLLLLLGAPAPLELDPLLGAAAVDGPPALVALASRWQPWSRTVAAAVPLAGPPVQVTVRGWPTGIEAAAELVDLVGLWCGEVVAAIAAPAPLPADRLPDGPLVSWALLTASGATVLVAHGGAEPLVRVSFADTRLEASADRVRWSGGDALPLLRPPPWVPLPPHGAALAATAATLVTAVGGGEPRPVHPGPGPADLADLLAVARVLAALRDSARLEQATPVS